MPVQIKCGGAHCALVTNDGQLYTWGAGRYGATGLGLAQTSFEPACPTFKGIGTSSPVEKQLIVKSVSCGRHATAIVTQ